MRRFKAIPGKGIVASTYVRAENLKNETPNTLPGSIINDRLINLCYWSENNAQGIIDDDEEYTLSELEDILSDECASSGEFDSTSEAVKWGEKCAKAIFENRSPY